MRAVSLALLTTSIALAAVASAPPARADVVALPRQTLVVRAVRAIEVSAPSADRDLVIARVRAGMRSFSARITRCLLDRGAPLDSDYGRLRARLRYDRSELPTRARIVENTLGAAAAACIDEVLPSLLVRPAPRGALTIEFTLAPDWITRW
ncbi:MAG: hypothetical protein M3Y87_35330 [Myxococcota bacterium]|nr:hypothetical protein [Myxococcota bacterium]